MSGLNQPTYVLGHNGNLYVVERGGTIRVRRHGRMQTRPFLNISAHVTTAGDEQGLLSMALAPRFDRNGRDNSIKGCVQQCCFLCDQHIKRFHNIITNYCVDQFNFLHCHN